MTKLSLCLFALALCLASDHAAANTVTLKATNSAWYEDTGENSLGGLNYVVGREGFEAQHLYHDFFVFNLSGISGVVTSAQLNIGNSGPGSGYSSPNPSETLTFFDVTTPVSQLGDESVHSVPIYNDLGSGIVYGSKQVSAADENTVVQIPLNGGAVSALNASIGAQWAIGGAMTSQNQPPGVDEFVFGLTDDTFTRQLVLTVVPEPSSVVLAALGLIGVSLLGAYGVVRVSIAGRDREGHVANKNPWSIQGSGGRR